MATTVNKIYQLPDNILLEILTYLSVKDRCISGRVCRRWRKIVLDNSLWRHVDLLPYQLDLRKMWKLVRAHLSDRLLTLRIRGVMDTKTHEVKPPLSESMVEELRGRCPKLAWLHMEPGNVTNLPSATLLPASLTHLTLKKSTWQPRWLKDSASYFTNLIYLDLGDTVRVDNHDMKDVAQFTTLSTLKLDNCYRLNEQGLQEIVKTLTNLTTLSLRGCDSSDLVIHHMARHLILLEDLDLSGSKSFTESSLPTLIGGLLKLEQLTLNGCRNLTVKAFSALSKGKRLRKVSLVLTDGRISENEITPWQDEMPKCTILV